MGQDSKIEWCYHAIPNVWLGVSVENQQTADERIPLLLQCPARVRFLSCEPLLGPVNLLRVLDRHECKLYANWLHWVIIGGESGPGARPCDVAWIRSLVRQCQTANVACFVKQLGANIRGLTDRHGLNHDAIADVLGSTYRLRDCKGGNPDEWPADLRVREFPNASTSKQT